MMQHIVVHQETKNASQLILTAFILNYYVDRTKSNTTMEQFHRQVFCPARGPRNGSVTRHQWVKGVSGGFLFATFHKLYIHLKDLLFN